MVLNVDILHAGTYFLIHVIFKFLDSNLEDKWFCYHSVQKLLSSKLLSKNLKIRYIYNYNFAYYFMWVWNLVADIEGGKEAEGVWEYGVDENIWSWEGRGNGRMEEIA